MKRLKMASNILSINRNVLKVIRRIIEEKDELKIRVDETSEGATIIDAGIDAQGGYMAGKYVTEACMGGLGTASVGMMVFGELYLPTITVTTDFPAVALFGAQFAGWRVNVGKYFAMGSGPARALALKPKELYDKIDYRDEADTATIILETSAKPSREVIEYISKECKVSPEKLYIIVASTSSIAGSTQISGRIAETGLHKLTEVGLDPKTVLSAAGYAPIAPVHPKPNRAMGRTNDMILYGGVAFFNVAYDDDAKLREFVENAPSSRSSDYGRPFADIFKDAGYDFYKIDAALFAPAVVVVNNVKSGKSFKAGEVNTDVLGQSLCL